MTDATLYEGHKCTYLIISLKIDEDRYKHNISTDP